MSRIPKRRGGFREINAPDKFLRLVQARILTRVLNGMPTPEYTWAFEKGRSVPEMAKVHVGKDCIISIDIKDFFPSITQRMVHTLIERGGVISGSAARTVSELCTYKWYLPQGGITSPKISNLVVKDTFGDDVHTFCTNSGLDVTIYADDITMSEAPGCRVVRENSVLVVQRREEGEWKTITSVSDAITHIATILSYHNFRVNKEKTKVMLNGSRKTVCGVVVNEKTNLSKKERLKLRAMVHNVCTNGLKAEAERFQEGATEEQFLNHLQGRLNWFQQLNPDKATPLQEKLRTYLLQSEEQTTQEETEQVVA